MAMRSPSLGLDAQDVVYEVEVNLQRARAMPHGQRAQAARGGMEGDVPAVVDGRREREHDLAHDLHPQLQRGAGICPCGLWQGWPGFGV